MHRSPQVAGYGRFSNTYAHVKDYLENLPAALVLPDRTNLSFTVTNRAGSAGQSVRLTTQSAGQIPYKLRSDASWIQISAPMGNTSANAPSPVTITLDAAQLAQPGQYKGTVTIFPAPRRRSSSTSPPPLRWIFLTSPRPSRRMPWSRAADSGVSRSG